MPRLAAPKAQAAWRVELPEAVTALVNAPPRVWVGCADGALRALDPTTGEVIATTSLHRGAVLALARHPDGALASGGEDGLLRLVAADLTPQPEPWLCIEGWLEQLAWSPDGSWLAAASGRQLWLFDPEGQRQREWEASNPITALHWNRRRELLVAAKGALYRFTSSGFKSPGALKPVTLNCPSAVAASLPSPKGNALAVGGYDKLLQLWLGLDTAKPRQFTMRGYGQRVAALAWRGDGQRLASAGGHEIVVWETNRPPSGQRPLVLRHHQQSVTHLCFTPDQRLLSADRSGLVVSWRGAKADVVAQLDGDITALSWRSAPSPGVVAAAASGQCLFC